MNKSNMPQMGGIVTLTDSSDLKDSFKELNDDTIDGDGFTAIDMRTRLTPSQVPALVGLDILSISGVYPKSFARIGRSIKRLSVSVKGKGRTEMVDIVKGVRESDAVSGQSVIDRTKQ